MMIRTELFACSLLAAVAAQAALVDTMDSTANFAGSFGGVSATAQGDGTVLLGRSVAEADAGIQWTDAGGKFSLAAEPLLSIVPSAPVNGGYYSTQILFFDAGGTYVAEVPWITDTNSTAGQSVDLATWGSTPVSAAEYTVHIRVLPWDSSNGAFAFDQMSAVPEPAAAAVLGLAAVATLRRRRV